MPVAGGSGGGTGKSGGKGGKQSPIVVYNPATGTTATVSSSGSSSSSSSGTTRNLGTPKGGSTASGTKSGSSAASSASSSVSSAQAAYDKQRKSDARAAQDRYITDAENMQGQVDALRAALGRKGEFKDALKVRLRNIDRVTRQQMGILDDVAEARAGSLDKDQRNNSMAAGDSSNANEANRARERMSALGEAAAQGAGESDSLRAQLMSLRNWDANQEGINRAFADSQQSIQAARLDLQADTFTAKANAVSEANADRGQLWNEFYAQSAESFTQLGNTLGQQAEYYGLAAEQGAKLGGGGKDKGKGGKGGKGGKDKDKDKGLSQWGSQDGGGKGGGRGDGESGGLGQMTGRPGAGSLDPEKGPKQYGSGLGGTRFQEGGGDGRGGKRRKKGNLQEQSAAQSDRAFMQAANQMGKAWRDPGLGDFKEFTPNLAADEMQSNSLLQSARTVSAAKAPEGATLRKW